jgi:hypothetical protein
MKNLKLAVLALLFAMVLLVAPGQSQELQTFANTGVSFTFPTLSATGQTASIAVNNVIPTKHGVQVNTTGSPASCTYNLEGSLDNANWTSIINAQVCTTSGTLTWESTGAKPVRFVRINLTALSASSSATAIYVGSK